MIHVWTNAYREMLRVGYLTENDVLSGRVRSIDTTNDGKKIILGTSASEIIELYSNDLKVSQNSKYLKADINKGPFTPDSVDRYEMWGLAVFRSQEKTDTFLTCSDDGYLRFWSIKLRAQTHALSLERNTKGEIVPKSDDAKLRCVSLNPREDYAAVGCKSGLIRVALFY
jgi:WD40 repeat protein